MMLLARGAHGEVHVGTRKGTVVKTVDNPRIAAREVAMLRALRHGNIVRLLSYDPSTRQLEMEHGGQALIDRMPEDVHRVAMQVADALWHMHTRRVAHLDLKLDNIVADDQGRVRVIDLGLARYFPAGTEPRMNQPLGSEAYIAPEAWVQPSYDAFAADVWSYGVVVYCLQRRHMLVHKAHASDEAFVAFRENSRTMLPHDAIQAVYPSGDSPGWYVDVVNATLGLVPEARASAHELPDLLRRPRPGQ